MKLLQHLSASLLKRTPEDKLSILTISLGISLYGRKDPSNELCMQNGKNSKPSHKTRDLLDLLLGP
jgi:hypothetical protein